MFIESFFTVVPDDSMASISSHGGLVHVVMGVKSVSVDGVISLVRNSPKLIALLNFIIVISSRDKKAPLVELRNVFPKKFI